MATLLVSGPGAIAVVGATIQPASGVLLEASRPGRLVFGRLGGPAGEEVVARVRPDRAVELHCHGGQAAIARIEEVLVGRGCRAIPWQVWVRAQERDPIAAAARLALAETRTERTAAILLDQYQGALGAAIEGIRQAMRRGDPGLAAGQLAMILDRAELGRHLVAPWKVVLAGPPNVGKSRLINALVGYQRSIVHPTAGTTRDVLTAATALEGWPMELSDTAGLRNAAGPLEHAGIELARERLAGADLVVLVFDASQPWSTADQTLLQSLPGALIVYNKIDLPATPDATRPFGVLTSAATGQGIEELTRRMVERLVPTPPPAGAAVPFTSDQIDRLQAVAAALARDDLPTAQAALGKGVAEEQLGRMP